MVGLKIDNKFSALNSLVHRAYCSAPRREKKTLIVAEMKQGWLECLFSTVLDGRVDVSFVSRKTPMVRQKEKYKQIKH